MVKTWIADITPLLEEQVYQHYYDHVIKVRKAKADALKNPLKKTQSIGVWVLWKWVQEVNNLDDFHVHNFSHSGNYAMVSVDMRRDSGILLGCDIQEIGEFRLPLVERFFTGQEITNITSQSDPEVQKDLFYRYWVLKEAYMKATGRGMGVDTRSFEIILPKPKADAASRETDIEADIETDTESTQFIQLATQPSEYASDYHLYEFDLGNIPYKAAVCTTSDEVQTHVSIMRSFYGTNY